ncbi:MAG: hypothetical protein FWD12_14330, partial [Alphaproteobacteria bacterium]|nr:hypothetical protein [Alphaproteobacteria bacterium]
MFLWFVVVIVLAAMRPARRGFVAVKGTHRGPLGRSSAGRYSMILAMALLLRAGAVDADSLADL